MGARIFFFFSTIAAISVTVKIVARVVFGRPAGGIRVVTKSAEEVPG